MATAAITVLSLPCQSPHFPQLKWFINNFLPRERERSSYCTPLPWISFSPSQTLKSFDHQYRSALHRVIFSWIVRKSIICPATGRARLSLRVYELCDWLTMVVLDDMSWPGAGEDWNIPDYHQIIRLSRGPNLHPLNAKLEQLPVRHRWTEGLRFKAQQ